VQDTDAYAKKVGKGYLVGERRRGRLPMPNDYSPVRYSGRDPKYLQLRERIRSDPFRIGGLDAAATKSHSWKPIAMILGSPDKVIRKLRDVLSARTSRHSGGVGQTMARIQP